MSMLSTKTIRPICLIVTLVFVLFAPHMASGQFLDLRVDGDNGSPTGDGSDWALEEKIRCQTPLFLYLTL